MEDDELFSIKITPELLLRAYRAGIFPMAECAEDKDIFWVCPQKRGIIPLDKFHISRSLRKTINRGNFTIKIDNDFEQVITSCAKFGTNRETSWINETIIDLYSELFSLKYCHTVEIWNDNNMVGGLYGVSIGAAFFGESMFHKTSNSSKIALAHLVKRLKFGGYKLLDTQFMTPHLRSMGGIEIDREEYENLLRKSIAQSADFYLLPIDDDLCINS